MVKRGLDAVDAIAASFHAESEARTLGASRQRTALANAGFSGVVESARGNRVAVSTSTEDGRTRTVRDVLVDEGYSRASIGDAVYVRRLADGSYSASALGSPSDGGRGAAFWARVTRTFQATRTDKDGNERTLTTRVYATPLKDSARTELLAYVPAALGADGTIRTGSEVWLVRDDGGYTESSADSYESSYTVANVRLRADYYGRLGSRPQESYTLYPDVKVGTSEPASAQGNGVKLRSLRVRFREERGAGFPDKWWDTNSSSDRPDGALDVEDFGVQYWRVGRTTLGVDPTLDDKPVQMIVITETENAKDVVEVSGGLQIDDLDEGKDDPEDDNWESGVIPIATRPTAPPVPLRMDGESGPDYLARYNAWRAQVEALETARIDIDYEIRQFRGLLARSVSVLYIDVYSAEKNLSARYTVVVERNNPYNLSDWVGA